MTFDEFWARVQEQLRAEPEKHGVFPGVTDSDLDEWRKENPGYALNADVMNLWRVTNGLELSREKFRGELINFYLIKIYPLQDIRYAEYAIFGNAEYQKLPQSWLAVAEDDCGTFYIVLNDETGELLKVEAETAFEPPKHIANNLDEFADWLRHYLDLPLEVDDS